MESAHEWAKEEFCEARLGDGRRTARLVELAAEVAERPAGKVMQVCQSGASREGAFRFLQSTAVRYDGIARSIQRATLRRCEGRDVVFVAVDGTSLCIQDEKRTKGLGPIGTANRGARGLLAMSALVVSDSGQPLGLAAQKLWVRPERSGRKEGGRPKHGGESAYWREVLEECRSVFADERPEVTPWFQLDRGGDCWQVLQFAAEAHLLVTVRATYDRRLDETHHRLWQHVERTRVLARTEVVVGEKPASWKKKRVDGKQTMELVPPQKARVAYVAIRAATVTLQVNTPEGVVPCSFNVVHVRELGRRSHKLEWMLLTTHAIATLDEVHEVIRGYAMRWRVEDFHRAWKSGVCNVEDTQLRSRHALFKWVTLLAAVATRAQRLTHQARQTPDVPASSELSKIELRALTFLRKPRPNDPAVPTLQQAVEWIAELGGWGGRWNGPPGPIVIARGLYDLAVAVRVLQNSRKK